MAHFKTQHLAYRKNSSEWEILGELGLRLHHKEEAKDAFQRCLDGKFSAKAWLRLLEMYAEEGDLSRLLQTAVRVAVYGVRWVAFELGIYLIFSQTEIRLVYLIVNMPKLLYVLISHLSYFTGFPDLSFHSIQLRLHTTFSNLVKLTATPKYLTHFSVWDFQTQFWKLWRVT